VKEQEKETEGSRGVRGEGGEWVSSELDGRGCSMLDASQDGYKHNASSRRQHQWSPMPRSLAGANGR